MKSGNLVLVLHTHIPYVLHHGDYPHGENWVYEAVAECYIPLLNVFNQIKDKKIKVAIDFSPILCEQIASPYFKKKFIEYLKKKIELTTEEKKNFSAENNSKMSAISDFWINWYNERLYDFEYKYSEEILLAFKKLQDEDIIEIMTCGATHGYLPLLAYDYFCELQIKLAVENYKKHFGREPRGIWLPECAYRPEYMWHTYFDIDELKTPKKRKGIEQILSDFGLKYFITDEKFIRDLTALGRYDSFEKNNFISIESQNFTNKVWNFHNDPLNLYQIASNIESVDKGTVAVFARHRELSMQVWSGENGYPADGEYLDFHKKIFPSANRYWRITDVKADMAYKQVYYPESIEQKIDLQSNHFIHHLENTANFFKHQTGKDAILTLAFDTELFGHWWFEGPQFIKYLLEGISNSPWIQSNTPEKVYYEQKPSEVVKISEGSWGENNDHSVWINESNKWMWEREYKAEIRFIQIIESLDITNLSRTAKRVLIQAVKELLLMQASDWQFLVHTAQARDYAKMRFTNHESDFNALCDIYERVSKRKNISLRKNELLTLTVCESRNNIFPEIKFEHLSSK